MSNDALTHPTDALAATHALLEAATTAGYAPSIHNTQPWRSSTCTSNATAS